MLKENKQMSDKKLFLLDGHALVYRAHFAFITRPLINSKGLNTSAISGFTRVLLDIIKKQKPTHIAVSFDLKGPTFRHEMFSEYKANRDAQPEDISLALPYIQEIIKAFNIPVVTKEGYEADDVIGTLAKQAEKEGFEVYMVTPDKDYAQLISDNIFMFKPGRKGGPPEIIGVKEALEQWNIQKIEQVIDVLGLQGDKVDNIPGVPGVGPKTATTLLKDYDSIENIIANADKLKGKLKEKIKENADLAILSKKLATIDLDVPVQFDADEYKIVEINKEKTAEIFKELEFRTLAKSVLEDPKPAKSKSTYGVQGNLFGLAEPSAEAPATHSMADHNIYNTDHEYHVADSKETQEALIYLLERQKEFCFDTETTSIDANNAELVGIAFSFKEHEAYYVPFPIDQNEAKTLLNRFKHVFENKGIAKIAHNIKYDALILKWYGIHLQGQFYDTLIAHYLIEPEARHSMDIVAENILKYQPVSIKSLIGSGKRQLSMRTVDLKRIKEYAGEDADITFQLYKVLFPKLEEVGMRNLYDTMEEPLIKTLIELEFNGVNIDKDYLKSISVDLDEMLKEMEKEIYDAAGVRFNISSPKQVGQVLFERLEIPYRWKKGKSKAFSTSEDKLKELSLEYKIVADILKYRGLAKLKSTYVDSLPKLINPKSKRIHSSFNQALTATGRLSSNNPNLQNIPIRSKAGAKVREAFVPMDENHIIVAADYSQIELRLIAELSGEEAMLTAFQKGQDIHTATAANVFEIPYEEVTKEQRTKAKTVNFSIIYGAGATNLSKQLGIKRAEAAKLIKQYFTKYSGLRAYMEDVVAKAVENGYVETLMGRKRYLRNINSRNSFVRSHAERNAVNTPVQGTAADMIKLAMNDVQQAIEEGNYKTKMIMQVHDELVFDMPKDEQDALIPIIEEKMQNAIPNLKVPILVEVGVGKNWLEAH